MPVCWNQSCWVSCLPVAQTSSCLYCVVCLSISASSCSFISRQALSLAVRVPHVTIHPSPISASPRYTAPPASCQSSLSTSSLTSLSHFVLPRHQNLPGSPDGVRVTRFSVPASVRPDRGQCAQADTLLSLETGPGRGWEGHHC